MPVNFLKGSITDFEADAIVNPTDGLFSGSGGIDKKIHLAAGSKLKQELKEYDSLNVGDAVITKTYNLSTAKYIIHVYGPKYIDGNNNEELYLRKCYRNVLETAKKAGCKSIAMPLISTGAFNYPKYEVKRIAKEECDKFLYDEDNDMDIYILIYGGDEFDSSLAIFEDIIRRINHGEVYFSEEEKRKLLERRRNVATDVPVKNVWLLDDMESFNDYFKRIIKEKNLKEKDVYKNSNLTKAAFDKIYKYGSEPKRENALALAMGMRLNIEETKEFMEMAGYSFGRRKIDIIVASCIIEGFYNVVRLNYFLSRNYQDILLGSK